MHSAFYPVGRRKVFPGLEAVHLPPSSEIKNVFRA
jgi:hypothetical protein